MVEDIASYQATPESIDPSPSHEMLVGIDAYELRLTGHLDRSEPSSVLGRSVFRGAGQPDAPTSLVFKTLGELISMQNS